MTPELRETVSRFLDNASVPPAICSDFSAFDAISEITGRPVSTREELFESPLSEVFAFEPTVKAGKETMTKKEAEEKFRKSGKSKDATYGVEEIRRIIAKSHMSGQDSGRKAVVIFDADRMTPEAANAFLKTLEDVPERTFFLLTVDSRAKLLDTVISRCLFFDSNETALEPDSATMAMAEAYLMGDGAEMTRFSIDKKPDRSKCLSVLSAFGRLAAKGLIRDEKALLAISEAYATIATTNVSPYYELDRALFEIAESVIRKRLRK